MINDGEYIWYWLKDNKDRGRTLYEAIKEHLKSDDTILDVNCGYSPLAEHLQSYDLKGFDNHIRPIMHLKQTYRNNDWHLMSYEKAWIPCSVMLILGMSDYSGFYEYIDRAIKFSYPRLIMVEASTDEDNVKNFYYEVCNLINKRYNLLESCSYDGNTDIHQSRNFDIFTLEPNGDPSTYKAEFNSPGYDSSWYNHGVYRKRNEVIVEKLKDLELGEVFEFACSFGFLAEMILNKIDSVKKYVCTNILSEVINIVKIQVVHEKFLTYRLDVNNTLPIFYDTYICTAFEHIEKDLALIKLMKRGANFIFSVPNFRHYTHFRTFQNENEIRQRYSEWLNIKSVTQIDTNNFKKKFVVVGEVI